jgi:YVTN family beta-propeller protein
MNRAGRPIRVGRFPDSLAITPDGRTLYVVNGDSGTVTPVNTATNRPGRPIRVGLSPVDIAITP